MSETLWRSSRRTSPSSAPESARGAVERPESTDAARLRRLPASPEPRRAVASLDLGPHTAQRRLLDEALDAGWDLDERCGALRPPERLRGGAPNPLACLAECGDPQCGCNRLRNPTVRGSFALKILDNAAPQRPTISHSRRVKLDQSTSVLFGGSSDENRGQFTLGPTAPAGRFKMGVKIGHY